MGDGSAQLRVAGFLLSNARPIVPPRQPGCGVEFMFRGIGNAPKVRQAVGADYLRRTVAQIGHTSAFPFLCIPVFPFAYRKITCQRIEENNRTHPEVCIPRRHQLPRVLAPWHGRPISVLAVSSGDNIAPAFCSSVPIRCVLLWDQGKQILVLIVQVIQCPAEGRKFLSQGCRPFSWDSFIYWTQRHQSVHPAAPGPVRPIFLEVRQSVLYGSVKFQNVQCIRYDLCPVWHKNTPF